MEAIIKHHENLLKIISGLDVREVKNISDIFLNAIRSEKKIIFIGNGGSAANAIHFSCDLNNAFSRNKTTKFHSLSLVENISTILAVANDYNFDEVFTSQLSCYLAAGDILVCLSSSGNSRNVVKACEYVKDNYADIKIISFTGFDGGIIRNLSSINLNVLIDDTQVAEDVQLITFHAIYKQLCLDMAS